MKAEIDAGYAVHLKRWNEENPDGQKNGQKKPTLFAFRNNVLMKRYKAKSEEMKAKVEEHRKGLSEPGPDEVNRQYQM